MYVSNFYTSSYQLDEPLADSTFDWVTYINNYPDLAKAGIDTRAKAIEHWNAHGFAENRTDKPLLDTTPTVSDETFDWETYAANYPDLQEAGITSQEDLTRHWNTHGKKEGRTSSPIYEWQRTIETSIDITLPPPNLSDIIPRVIYQTWYTKDLLPEMDNAVQMLKYANPGFRHELFDDTDCRNFIKSNFPPKIVYAYDSLIPGAYKADLWRYCMLYLNGGIYIDIKFEPVDGFSFESLIYDGSSDEYWCKDRDGHFKNKIGVYNAIMIVKPGNAYLAKAIKHIYLNCLNRNYADSSLSVTGPGLLGSIIPQNIEFFLDHSQFDRVTFRGNDILVAYNEYRDQRSKQSAHYNDVWGRRAVFNKHIPIV